MPRSHKNLSDDEADIKENHKELGISNLFFVKPLFLRALVARI